MGGITAMATACSISSSGIPFSGICMTSVRTFVAFMARSLYSEAHAGIDDASTNSITNAISRFLCLNIFKNSPPLHDPVYSTLAFSNVRPSARL
jgi:hypothetical protein